MSETKIIIAGCGIAGPILAILLKQKGYDPVVYERLDSVQDAGLSLCLQLNGFKVLATIPGLIESLEGGSIERFLFYSVMPEDHGVLADSDAPLKMKQRFGYGPLGVSRSNFHRKLVEAAQKAGVETHFGHHLVALHQAEDNVTVTFKNGNTATGSFVVGCDGLHSDTRACLFGRESATFTGLVQSGGISPTPEILLKTPTMMNVFGNGAHMVAYPISETHTSWATTRREPEAKESWRDTDDEAQRKFKEESPFATWECGVAELVKSADKIIKYGIYDRPPLQTWHKDRVVLIGDAAHPTSPHLGQGANQAFEDCQLLSQLLAQHNPDAASPPTESLKKIFTEFEQVRIPKSAMLVEGARKQGDARVAEGVEECKKRNDVFREIYKSDESIAAHFAKFFEELKRG